MFLRWRCVASKILKEQLSCQKEEIRKFLGNCRLYRPNRQISVDSGSQKATKGGERRFRGKTSAKQYRKSVAFCKKCSVLMHRDSVDCCRRTPGILNVNLSRLLFKDRRLYFFGK